MNFEHTFLFITGALAAEDPLNSKSPRNITLGYMDIVFTTIFTFEIVVKVIAYGAVFHPGAYCRSPANILDLVVVSVSLISLAFRYISISYINVFDVYQFLLHVLVAKGPFQS